MNYKIGKLEKILEDGVAVRQLLTLEVTYADASTSSHGKYLDLDADPETEAVAFAAELDAVLKEPVEVTSEEVILKNTQIEVSAVTARKVVQAEALTEVTN